MKLFSLSRALLGTASEKVVETFAADPVLRDWRYDVCFGHAASKRVEEAVMHRLGVPLDKYFGTHALYGNTVSASVPLAMSLALESGRLTRGTRVLILVAAGGIVVGMASFTF